MTYYETTLVRKSYKKYACNTVTTIAYLAARSQLHYTCTPHRNITNFLCFLFFAFRARRKELFLYLRPSRKLIIIIRCSHHNIGNFVFIFSTIITLYLSPLASAVRTFEVLFPFCLTLKTHIDVLFIRGLPRMEFVIDYKVSI